VRQIKLAIRQLLGARKYSVSYRIVSYLRPITVRFRIRTYDNTTEEPFPDFQARYLLPCYKIIRIVTTDYLYLKFNEQIFNF